MASIATSPLALTADPRPGGDQWISDQLTSPGCSMKARARLAAILQLGLGLLALVLETVRVSSTFHEVTLSTFGEGFYCGAVFLGAGLLHLLLLGGDKQLHQVGQRGQ